MKIIKKEDEILDKTFEESIEKLIEKKRAQEWEEVKQKIIKECGLTEFNIQFPRFPYHH